MVLSDRDIRRAIASGRIAIDPLDEEAVQPASVDLRLGADFRVFAQHQEGFIDVKKEMLHLTEVVTIGDSKPFFLHPGEFALAVTLEHVALSDDLVGRLDGRVQVDSASSFTLAAVDRVGAAT
jgi:dCTP deaminase